MAFITFYRQARFDGGIRTGITVDGELVWQGFEPGQLEEDPALLWYVDLRCSGERLPDEREAARDWLLDQAGTVRTAFNELADKLQVGYDDEAWPCQFNVSQAPAGVSMKIVCSAIRGLEPGEVAEVLRKTGKNWKKLLQRLELAEVMS